jgi:3-methylfumaryl-CoA hydratase
MTCAPDIDSLHIGDTLPRRVFTCDNVQQMLYNASLWNGHRIHFDHPYATSVEGYPGLVVAGPLVGDWMLQCLMEWLGEAGELERLSYTNRTAAYVGETLTSAGRITAIDKTTGEVTFELCVRNAANDVVVPGTAIVRLPIADT